MKPTREEHEEALRGYTPDPWYAHVARAVWILGTLVAAYAAYKYEIGRRGELSSPFAVVCISWLLYKIGMPWTRGDD